MHPRLLQALQTDALLGVTEAVLPAGAIEAMGTTAAAPVFAAASTPRPVTARAAPKAPAPAAAEADVPESVAEHFTGSDAEADAELRAVVQRYQAVAERLYPGSTPAVVPPVGSAAASLLIVTDAPGDDAPAGDRVLNQADHTLMGKAWERLGLAAEACYTAALVPWPKPLGVNNIRQADLEACLPLMLEQVRLVRPKVLLALGAHAMRALTGAEGIIEQRGRWLQHRNGPAAIPVMPTLHPGYVNRQPTKDVRLALWTDLQAVHAAVHA